MHTGVHPYRCPLMAVRPIRQSHLSRWFLWFVGSMIWQEASSWRHDYNLSIWMWLVNQTCSKEWIARPYVNPEFRWLRKWFCQHGLLRQYKEVATSNQAVIFNPWSILSTTLFVVDRLGWDSSYSPCSKVRHFDHRWFGQGTCFKLPRA